MVVRGLVLYGNPAVVDTLRADLSRELQNSWKGHVHVIVDHYTGDNLLPAALLSQHQPHFVFCMPPVGSFSRAATGRRFGPTAMRDAEHPLGRTNTSRDAFSRAAEQTRLVEFCVLAYALAATAGILAILIAPERLGSNGPHAAASLWDSDEVKGILNHELGFYGAAYACDLAGEGPKKPVRVLATDLSILQPPFVQGPPVVEHHGGHVLYKGPLPHKCQCEQREHPPRSTIACSWVASP